ncbi:hypothetical protein CEXT_739901 [Caerostris extrusa]|uniref:Uncharacterized protein n=1 Tax=Caerostris extrusa TaxID=172846 RepID=A0AAV4WXS4_CAEEX|nr:hypothetical protein CEXT_739901 [Caerostris extrusa]
MTGTIPCCNGGALSGRPSSLGHLPSRKARRPRLGSMAVGANERDGLEWTRSLASLFVSWLDVDVVGEKYTFVKKSRKTPI